MKNKEAFKCSKCKKEVKILCQFCGFSGYKYEDSVWYCEDCFKKIEKRNGFKQKEMGVKVDD